MPLNPITPVSSLRTLSHQCVIWLAPLLLSLSACGDRNIDHNQIKETFQRRHGQKKPIYNDYKSPFLELKLGSNFLAVNGPNSLITFSLKIATKDPHNKGQLDFSAYLERPPSRRIKRLSNGAPIGLYKCEDKMPGRCKSLLISLNVDTLDSKFANHFGHSLVYRLRRSNDWEAMVIDDTNSDSVSLGPVDLLHETVELSAYFFEKFHFYPPGEESGLALSLNTLPGLYYATGYQMLFTSSTPLKDADGRQWHFLGTGNSQSQVQNQCGQLISYGTPWEFTPLPANPKSRHFLTFKSKAPESCP